MEPEITSPPFIRQRLDHAPHFYHHVPLSYVHEYRFSIVTETVDKRTMHGLSNHSSFNPAFVCVDMQDKIEDAITDDYAVIKTTGLHNFIHGKMNLSVTAVGGDSAFIRIEHNFVAPDAMINPMPNLHLSQERYWRVDGIIPPGFDAKSTITFNGTNTQPATSYNGGYLDTRLITNIEDSLVVMYRPVFLLIGR
jgi:hypothetical protein